MKKEYASRCELKVMKVLWESKEDLSLQPIMMAANDNTGNDWKPQTISTFLARLVKKGWIEGYRKGRYVYYRPLITRTEWIIAAVAEDCDIANIPSETIINEVCSVLNKLNQQ